MQEINVFYNNYMNQTAYIIGKGPSLDNLDPNYFEPRCPIICLNETVTLIEKFALSGEINNDIFSLQQDGLKQCMRKPKLANLLLGKNSENYFPDYNKRYSINKVKRLGLKDDAFTALVAIEFARLLGCNKIIFISFDACTSKDIKYPSCLGNLYYDPKNEWRLKIHCDGMRNQLKGLEAIFYTPEPLNKIIKEEEEIIKPTTGDFTVITPTGDRDRCFELCRKYLFRQTMIPKQWLVIDDGKVPMHHSLRNFTDYHRREPSENDPKHTLRLNMREALKHIKYKKAIIVEDDDWYSKYYCEYMLNLMNQGYDLVGQSRTIYYNLPRACWARCHNMSHASFCQTGFTDRVFNKLEILCNIIPSTPFLDLDLWRIFQGRKFVDKDITKMYCIGMKGLPGRAGLTSGHKAGSGFTKDQSFNYLQRFIGMDKKEYLEMIGYK